MLKILGSFCILSGGVLVWYSQAAERRREIDTLSGLVAALRRMAEEIRMARTPLPLLLDRVSQGCGGGVEIFFQAVSAGVRQGENLGVVWRRAAAELALSGAACAEMTGLGDDLRGDEENVCKAISLVIYSAERDLEERIRRRPEEAKRAAALCLSGAALLVILLI